MTSRLYRTTRDLYLAVSEVLQRLDVTGLGSPTLVALLTLAVSGLILLDRRPTQTRVAQVLPGRCHDALNRLLRSMPWATRGLMGLLIGFAKRLGCAGYLSLDDVIVEKAYAQRLPWAGWVYSFAKKRQVYGIQIVVWLWCSLDGRWRIPVAFRLRRPKRSCSPADYRTSLEWAWDMIVDVVSSELPIAYVVFDTHYTAGWFTKRLAGLGLTWQGTLDPKTNVVWRGHRLPVGVVARVLRLKWRSHLALRATALRVYAPKYGHLRLVVTRNRHGNYEYLVTNDRAADLSTVVRRKRSRWQIETLFRDSKQAASLEACQSWVNQAYVRHVGIVLLTFVVLQMLRSTPDEPVGSVKQRWQLAVLRDREQPPEPLRACPAELRVTA
jgi:hypothetical protein